MERWRIVLIHRMKGEVKVHYAINVRFGNIFIWILPSTAEDEIRYIIKDWRVKDIARVTKTDNGYKLTNEDGFIC